MGVKGVPLSPSFSKYSKEEATANVFILAAFCGFKAEALENCACPFGALQALFIGCFLPISIVGSWWG
jgi:hypothetical protein